MAPSPEVVWCVGFIREQGGGAADGLGATQYQRRHCLPYSFLADLVSELMPQPPEVIETYATLK